MWLSYACSKVNTAHPPYTNYWSRWRGQTYSSQAAGIPWHKATTEYPRGVPVRDHYWFHNRSQRRHIRSMTCGNVHLQVKMNGLKSKQCESMGHTTVSIFQLHLFSFSFKFGFVLGGGWQGQRADARKQGDREMSGIGRHDVKSTKNQ